MVWDRKQVTRRRFLKGAAVAAPAMAAANVLGSPKSSAQAQKWDKTVDVVIMGTGFAGLSAAIAAKDAGAKVLILEKMPQKYEGGQQQGVRKYVVDADKYSGSARVYASALRGLDRKRKPSGAGRGNDESQ